MILTDERHKRIWADCFRRQVAVLQAEDEKDRRSVIVTDRHPTELVAECLLLLKGNPQDIHHSRGHLVQPVTDGNGSVDIRPVTANVLSVALGEVAKFYRVKRTKFTRSEKPASLPRQILQDILHQEDEILARHFPNLGDSAERLRSVPLVKAILNFRDQELATGHGEWSGSMTDLMTAISSHRDQNPYVYWPGSPSAFSRVLHALADPLRTLGVIVTERRRNRGSHVAISWVDHNGSKSGSGGAGGAGDLQLPADPCSPAHVSAMPAI